MKIVLLRSSCVLGKASSLPRKKGRTVSPPLYRIVIGQVAVVLNISRMSSNQFSAAATSKEPGSQKFVVPFKQSVRRSVYLGQTLSRLAKSMCKSISKRGLWKRSVHLAAIVDFPTPMGPKTPTKHTSRDFCEIGLLTSSRRAFTASVESSTWLEEAGGETPPAGAAPTRNFPVGVYIVFDCANFVRMSLKSCCLERQGVYVSITNWHVVTTSPCFVCMSLNW